MLFFIYKLLIKNKIDKIFMFYLSSIYIVNLSNISQLKKDKSTFL